MTRINFGLKVGDVCKLKNNDNYAKIKQIDYFGKTYKIAKCEWSQQNPNKHDIIMGCIKYFKLSELKKCEKKNEMWSYKRRT